MIEMETKVVDRITGFTGIVTGRCEYLNGCIQYLVKPKQKKGDKEMPKGEWIDEQHLLVNGKRIDGSATAGGDLEPPICYRG